MFEVIKVFLSYSTRWEQSPAVPFFSALPAITDMIRLLMTVPNHVGVCASSVTVSTFGDTQMKHFKHRQKAAGGQAGKLKRQTVPLLMELMRT